MEALVMSPGKNPKGKIGLVFGFFSQKKPVFCSFAEVPKAEVHLPESLSELIHFKSQSFSMKSWVLQHAVQASKLLVPSMQVIGIYTCSAEGVIESKSGINSEINELLKKIQKITKNNQILHYHQDLTGKNKPVARVFDFFTGQNYLAGGGKEEKIDFVEIRAILKVFLDFEKGEVTGFQQVSEEFSKFVNGLVVRFKGLEKSAVIKESQEAVIYSKELGKVIEKPQSSIRGVLESRVFVIKGSSQDFVTSMIKQDLLKSFENRISLISSDFQEFKESFGLPRRVFYKDEFTASDYLMDDETLDDGKQRIEMLLGFSPSVIQEFEKKNSNQEKMKKIPEVTQKSPFKLILPILALLLSLILGIIVLNSNN
jgi:hypothetical protein